MDSSPRPPSPPWLPIPFGDTPLGCASIYYSDAGAKHAIREVMRPDDNKGDPNLETLTYGLFSTCERQMRAGIVDKAVRYIFFLTTRPRVGRVLAGYYDLGWYAPVPGSAKDFALAAKSAKFVHPGIPLAELPLPLRGVLGTGFRLFKYLTANDCVALLKLLADEPDSTAKYLVDIDRLERSNKSRTGYRCWRRKTPFVWSDARAILDPAATGSAQAVYNSSPTDRWRCVCCEDKIENKSRLRLCVNCGGVQTFVPDV